MNSKLVFKYEIDFKKEILFLLPILTKFIKSLLKRNQYSRVREQ